LSTLSVVVISVLAALFSILLIAAIAALVYTHILVRRQIAQFSLTIGGVGVKLDSQIAELKSLIGTIHGDRIEKAAATILEAIPRLTQFAIRAEKTVTAFENSLRIILGQQGGQQEISEDAIRRARQSGLGPDSYAPAAPDEHFVSRSKAAAESALALEREARSNTAGTADGAIDGAIDDFDPDSLNTFNDLDNDR